MENWTIGGGCCCCCILTCNSKSFAMFLGNFRCEKGPIWFQNRPIWFQNRPIWFQKGPIWFQKGPICFTGVPFHKCPIYFTDVPFISKQQVPQHYHCVLHLTAEGNKHTHLFQGRPIYFKASPPALSLRLASDCWSEQASYQQEMSTVQHDIPCHYVQANNFDDAGILQKDVATL